MNQVFVYLNPDCLNEFNVRLPFSSGFSRGILCKAVALFRITMVQQVKVFRGKDTVKGYIISWPHNQFSRKIQKKIQELAPNLVVTDGEVLGLDALKGLVPNCKVVKGITARLVGLTEILDWYRFNESFSSAPKIMLWGADHKGNFETAKILGRYYKSLILAGEKRHVLNSLAHSLLYESGLSVKISSNVERDLEETDILVTVNSGEQQLKLPWETGPSFRMGFIGNRGIEMSNFQKSRYWHITGPEIVSNRPSKSPLQWTFAMIEAVLLLRERENDWFFYGNIFDRFEHMKNIMNKHGFRLCGKALGEVV